MRLLIFLNNKKENKVKSFVPDMLPSKQHVEVLKWLLIYYRVVEKNNFISPIMVVSK